ncbi:hypothetical protein LTR84_004139 [Exophiala bonariae]|uniref:Monalysin Pore-forming domain-containing protein n=1 Tax=Exophiala bonariae TaxID=1690606 RepID=A0AAV9N5Q4_9EURO|nr:hypothetical protein LTR84_004139 [Exophiala bonariae]
MTSPDTSGDAELLDQFRLLHNANGEVVGQLNLTDNELTHFGQESGILDPNENAIKARHPDDILFWNITIPLELLQNLKVADGPSEVGRLMMGQGAEVACILSNEWNETGISLVNESTPGYLVQFDRYVRASMKPITAIQKYNDRIVVQDHQEVKHTFTVRKGVSKTTEVSLELTVGMGASIKGIFEFGVLATGKVAQSVTKSDETEETWEEKLKGPVDTWRYQQVVLYATRVKKSDVVMFSLILDADAAFYEKGDSYYVITPAYRRVKADSRSSELTTIKQKVFVEDLLISGFPRWSN